MALSPKLIFWSLSVLPCQLDMIKVAISGLPQIKGTAWSVQLVPSARQQAAASSITLSAQVHQKLLRGSASLQASWEGSPQPLWKRWHFLNALGEMGALC